VTKAIFFFIQPHPFAFSGNWISGLLTAKYYTRAWPNATQDLSKAGVQLDKISEKANIPLEFPGIKSGKQLLLFGGEP
jgi:hypothetical protein